MFKTYLSPESLARMEAERREVARLYRLGDAWLAAALLKLAREAQAAMPERRPDECTYDSRLIWGIVPEIARRLGVIKMKTDEIDWEIRELSDYELRLRTGVTMANIGWRRIPGWEMLSREPANGCPVVFAIDRLCPGRLDDKDDAIVQRLASVARSRGTEFAGTWTEAFCRRADVDGVAEELVDTDGEHPSA